MKVLRMLLEVLVFELIQYKFFRKIKKGKYRKIKPNKDGVGSYWTNSEFYYKEEEIEKVEEWPNTK